MNATDLPDFHCTIAESIARTANIYLHYGFEYSLNGCLQEPDNAAGVSIGLRLNDALQTQAARIHSREAARPDVGSAASFPANSLAQF